MAMVTIKSISVLALPLIGLIGLGGSAAWGDPVADEQGLKTQVQPVVSGVLTGRVTADKSRYNAVRFTVTLYNSGWTQVATKTVDNWFPVSGDYVDYSFDGLSSGYYYVQAQASVVDSDFWTPIYGLLTRHPWWPEYYLDSFTQAGATHAVVAGGSTTANIDLVLDPVSYIQMGTNPGGQPFEVDGVVYTASPTYFEWRRGDVHTIGVEEYYENPSGTRCYFQEWRQGGSRIQNYTVPPGRLSIAQGEVVDTLVARFNYSFFLRIVSTHGNPRGAGWYPAWSDISVSVEDTVVEKIPPHAFPAKALIRADTDSVRYVFDRWEGTGAGSYSGEDNPATVTMNFNITEKAFWKTQFAIAVQVSDTSMGTVSVNPPGFWQDRDSLVSVKAVPRSGFSFTGWEGPISESADSVAFIMDTSKVVLARFVRALHPPVISMPDTSFTEDDTLFLPVSAFSRWIHDSVDPMMDLTVRLESWSGPLHSKMDAGGVKLWTDPDWNGTGWWVVKVLDPEGSSATDTVHYRVTPIDDPPDPFALLDPVNGWVITSMLHPLFRWSASRNLDAVNGDHIRYVLYLGKKGWPADSVFATSDTSCSEIFLDTDTYRWRVKALDDGGTVRWAVPDSGWIITSLQGISDRNIVPVSFSLSQNYPNPFNPSTEIGYALPERSRVRIEIYSPTGKRLRTLVDRDRPAGEYTAVWDGADDSERRVGSGIYVCRMIAGRFSKTVKMTIMK
jgi:hypothetical protein